MAIETLANLRAYGGFVSTDDDTLLTSCLSRAQAIIENITGRVFDAVSTGTYYFDAEADIDGQTLFFGDDFISIVSVTNGDGALITSSQYVTEPRNYTPYYGITIKASSNLYWTYQTDPENAITVIGVRGYSNTPSDAIKQACLRLASWLYKQREADPNSDRPFITGEGVTIMPARLPTDVMDILRKYKKSRVRAI